MQVPAQEDRLDDLAQLDQRLVGRVLRVLLREAPQDRLRLGIALAQRGCVLDDLQVLLRDQLPVDGRVSTAERYGNCPASPACGRYSFCRLIPLSRGMSSKSSIRQNAKATSLWPWLST